MKTWLNQFKISNCLDDNNTLRVQMPNQEKSDDLRQFAESLQCLDRRLKAAQPTLPVPAGLHHSVMRAVRGVAIESERRFAPSNLRWLPVSAAALLVLAGALWILSRPERSSQPIVTAAAALEQGQHLTQQAPVAVLAPLSKELENLNRDFHSAVAMLVASVP